jgi:ribosome maturation factor RimP
MGRKWALAHFFHEGDMSAVQADIEARLVDDEPDVEVLLAEVVPGGTLRVFIDHPQGVTLELCERVSRHLSPLRSDYALEVSSPGSQRPLTKPQHFRRFLGRRARIRTRGPLPAGPREPAACSAPGPRRSFTGELVGASDRDVTVAARDGVVSIPYDDIQRSNLLGD